MRVLYQRMKFLVHDQSQTGEFFSTSGSQASPENVSFVNIILALGGRSATSLLPTRDRLKMRRRAQLVLQLVALAHFRPTTSPPCPTALEALTFTRFGAHLIDDPTSSMAS